jgi:hypothetical protein
MHPNTRGVALPEAVAAAAVVAVLMSLLVVANWSSRGHASAGRDLANLRLIAGWTESYGADNRDVFWTFSWRAGHQNSQWPELNNSPSDLQAAADQAVDILRRRTGRVELPRITAWIAHILYSHLPLVDYTDRSLPEIAFVSAGDEHRMNWARDPAGFDLGRFLPFQPDPTPTNSRWPYSASFLPPPMWFDRSDAPNRISQFQHNSYSIPSLVSFEGAPMSQVAFPSQKVLIHDQSAWHFGRPTYFGLEQSRAALLMADGSAAIPKTGDANEGWQPNNPTSPSPTQLAYVPRPWEPPTTTGNPGEPATGQYRWTRGGIAGIDFGGPEINTGQR